MTSTLLSKEKMYQNLTYRIHIQTWFNHKTIYWNRFIWTEVLWSIHKKYNFLSPHIVWMTFMAVTITPLLIHSLHIIYLMPISWHSNRIKRNHRPFKVSHIEHKWFIYSYIFFFFFPFSFHSIQSEVYH